MIDIKILREDIEAVKERLSVKNYDLDVELFLSLERQRKESQIQVEEHQQQINILSKKFGELKKNKLPTNEISEEIEKVKTNLESFETTLKVVKKSLDEILMDIPNIPDPTIPRGDSEDDNKLIKKCGKIKVLQSQDHLEISKDIDLEIATKLAGSRFSVLKNDVAKLHRALINFMLELAEKNGYNEYYVPFLANTENLEGTGQLPKFEEDLFKVDNDMYLIPTAEVPLTNLLRESIVDENLLPIKSTAHTPCFRSEAGSYGKDTRGLIRQHQFEKVELVQVVHPTKSNEALEDLLTNAEEVLTLLELPYQVVELCGGDLGFSAAKTYDIEVWLPSQECYREISSCSNFTDFQARRSKIKIKTSEGSIFAHTINGSALAVGRTLIAIIENHFDGKSKILIPKALQHFFKKPFIDCV